MSKNSVDFTELFDYSRPTAATYIDPTGVSLTSAAINEPRFSSDGLLIEMAATNLLINSQTPATQTVTVTNGASYTLASYGSGGGYSFVSSGGSGTAPIGTPITFTASGTSVEISVSGSLDGFQLEAGTESSSFMPTGGSSATRAADLLSRTLGNEYSSTVGSFYVELIHTHQSTLGNNLILSDGASNAFLRSVEIEDYELYNGSIARSYPTNAPSGIREKIAVSITTDEWILSRNGGSATYAVSTAPILDVSVIRLFELASGTASKFEYWPKAKTAAELEAITA